MRAFGIILLACALLCRVLGAVQSPPAARSSAAALLTETEPPPGFAYALAPRAFSFPADHAAHSRYRSEWWYYTGNLTGAGGRSFGFQLTIFRFALSPHAAKSDSPWRTQNLYLGHFALSDIDNARFYSFERRARPVLGQAGVESASVRIWIGDWIIARSDRAGETWQLRAERDGVAIDLELRAERPIIPQGDHGLSHKSASPGNASYYYSIPRLAASGTVALEGTEHAVKGNAWFDHEWGTSALASDQVGWDWFSLQLDDGRDLMFYQIRDANGRSDPASRGVIVAADGSTTELLPDAIEREVTAYWRSHSSGSRYPAGWRIRVPELQLDLSVKPRFNAQEWHKNFTYWEGTVSIGGTSAGTAVSGVGYVELVGY